MKKMKKSTIAGSMMLAVAMVGFTSCEKSDEIVSDGIEGVYTGTFSISNSLKSSALDGLENDLGTAEVNMMGDNRIEVHCFGEALDTTFMLDYYEHNDSVMVCLTGSDFSNMYGHGLGEGHMSGGMMGDRNGGDTEWIHHMDDEHVSGDEHFGGFNMDASSFTYSFRMIEGSTPHYLKFHGVKE